MCTTPADKQEQLVNLPMPSLFFFWRKSFWRLWSSPLDFPLNHTYTTGYWFKYKMASPHDQRCYLEHEPVPGFGDSIVFPPLVVVWRAVVLVPLQHLLQEEVGCELRSEEATQEGELVPLIPQEAKVICSAHCWGHWTLPPGNKTAQRYPVGVGTVVNLFWVPEIPL